MANKSDYKSLRTISMTTSNTVDEKDIYIADGTKKLSNKF